MTEDTQQLDEASIKKALDQVANKSSRNERVSWDRKNNKMISLLMKIQPIEDKITDLLAEKAPLMDDIQALRQEMVKDCVHPYTHLVYHDDHVVCKFCDRKFSPL